MNNTCLALIHANIVTPLDKGRPATGKEQSELKKINNGTILIEDGKIKAIGTDVDIPEGYIIVDAEGRLVTPGLVDPHTHVVHGGSREHEIPLKLRGASYMEIHQAGGGINSTVTATREATDSELFKKTCQALETMLCLGVTTVESKSGYGLNTLDELKMLRIAHQVEEYLPIDLVHTFMGAHAIPMEYRGQPDAYIEYLLTDMMPQIKDSQLAEFCDVFCEEGVFDVTQTEAILQAAKQYGFKLKLHADEIVPIGGAELAARLQAVSADHLMAASEQGLQDMAKAGVVAVVLPGTSFYLGKNYARAREMINLNVPLALATDYNPGSCPSENIQLVMTLAYLYLRLYPEEILTACTLNAAYAVDRAAQVGSLDTGKQADIVIWEADNLDYILYHFGINHVHQVIKGGKIVVQEGNVVHE